MSNRNKRESIDRAMERALKRRLQEGDPTFNPVAWKAAWYRTGRQIAERRAS
jgi:hypothetical protein